MTRMDAHGRAAQLRAISVLTRRPEHGRATKGGTAHVGDGLGCTYDEDGVQVTMDMDQTMGGASSAPAPGYYARAGLCGCVAIGIKMTALREDIPLRGVSARIAQAWDGRGVLGMSGASRAAEATELEITVDSSAPAEVIEDLVQAALAIDPWFLSFRDAQPMQVVVSLAEATS